MTTIVLFFLDVSSIMPPESFSVNESSADHRLCFSVLGDIAPTRTGLSYLLHYNISNGTATGKQTIVNSSLMYIKTATGKQTIVNSSLMYIKSLIFYYNSILFHSPYS